MSWQEISLEKLKRAEWNYKTDDPDLYEKLKRNIEKRGLIVNFIVREIDDGMFEVCNGNHRLEALLDLGRSVAMCKNLGSISLDQAKLVALETNEVEFKPDELKLATLLKQLESTLGLEELKKSLAYSQKHIVDMISMADWKMPQAEEPPTQTTIPTSRLLAFNLPDEVADLFREQLNRVSGLVGGEVLAFEAIAQLIAQADDFEFTK